MHELDRINTVEEMVAELRDEVITLRQTIHQNPELSFNEFMTSDMIFNILKTNPEIVVSRPTPTSVLAVLKGSKEGKVLAIRSDMDALALQEENEIAYRSNQSGIMHACGHDGHVAMLLGAVKILAQFKDKIQGEIRFIFQHAEEIHPGGARELVASGILDGVDMIFAIHLWATLDLGKVGLASGPLMAAPDNFNIVIKGKGGHAAMPEEVIDPIVVSANVITALQTIVSRNSNPIDPLVLSITGIEGGGTAYNVIPEKVSMKGTARTFNPETRRALPDIMENLIKGICSAYHADYTFQYELGYDPVINNDIIVRKISGILETTLGASFIHPMRPVMGGEDFSAYLHHVPGAIIFIGAGNKEKGIIYPHHHPRFNIDEDALADGLKVLALISLGLLDSLFDQD